MTLVGDTNQTTETKEESSDSKKETTKTPIFDNLSENSKVPVTDEHKDIVDNAALPGITSGSTENKGEINYEKYTDDDLMISVTEKNRFIDAMISGSRYYQSYTIFGGRISIVLRSRTNQETQAMYAYIRHMLSADGGNLSILEGDMQYVMIAAQVEEINGTKYPELKLPLTFTESAGEIEPPGWLPDMEAWKNKPEGLTSAIINRIQLFEYKYWRMVKEASNKNFWNSDTSTVA